MADDSEASHFRREAARCRDLALLTDESTAKTLIGLAEEYDRKALLLERPENRPSLHPTSDAED